MRVFLDTNVLLDVLVSRPPFFQAAAELWSLAGSGRIRGCISAISFDNIYFVIRKYAGRKKAREALGLLRDAYEVVPVDRRLLDQAIDSNIRDFEDAVQYYCAARAKARYLVTRNPKDFPEKGLELVSAWEFMHLVKAGDIGIRL